MIFLAFNRAMMRAPRTVRGSSCMMPLLDSVVCWGDVRLLGRRMARVVPMHESEIPHSAR